MKKKKKKRFEAKGLVIDTSVMYEYSILFVLILVTIVFCKYLLANRSGCYTKIRSLVTLQRGHGHGQKRILMFIAKYLLDI